MSEPAQIPPLHDPWLIAAFEGWNDAGEAATGVVDHLIDEWDAEVLVELDPEDFYDFQMNRPEIRSDEDGSSMIAWPTTTVYRASMLGCGRDAILVRGLEPNYRWLRYCSTLLGIAELSGVRKVVTLGALLADTPHTLPVPIHGYSEDRPTAERLALEPGRYRGPVGINGVFAEQSHAKGLTTVSLWAAVPHYLAEPPCPKAALALLGILEDVLETPLEQGLLAEMSAAWQHGADELMSSDEEIAEYVQSLEDERETSELPEASGDAIAREFERYLRRRSAGGES